MLYLVGGVSRAGKSSLVTGLALSAIVLGSQRR